MPRPPKYATAAEAARNNLYSKMGGLNMGLPIERFMQLATGKCTLCGQKPRELLVVDRSDGRHELAWHYVVATEDGGHMALCRMCKVLCNQFDLKELISHCARLMAKRMWQVHYKWTETLFQGQDKLILERSKDNDREA